VRLYLPRMLEVGPVGGTCGIYRTRTSKAIQWNWVWYNREEVGSLRAEVLLHQPCNETLISCGGRTLCNASKIDADTTPDSHAMPYLRKVR